MQYIEETEEIAMSGLKENRHILDMIVKELLENSRITGLVNEHICLFSFTLQFTALITFALQSAYS